MIDVKFEGTTLSISDDITESNPIVTELNITKSNIYKVDIEAGDDLDDDFAYIYSPDMMHVKHVWRGVNGKATLLYNYKFVVEVPTVSTYYDYHYDSSWDSPYASEFAWEYECSISNYDANVISVGGETSGHNAGTYTVTFDLIDTVNYIWSDGTTSQKTGTWNIAKYTPSSLLYDDYIVLEENDTVENIRGMSWYSPQTFTINNPHTDKLRIEIIETIGEEQYYHDEELITIPIYEYTFKVTSIADYTGMLSFSVSRAGSSNYNAVTNIVNVSSEYLHTVSWSAGTDAELRVMMKRHYRGEINVKNIWHIGDSRNVTININDTSYTLAMVLMHSGGKQCIKPGTSSTRVECAFIVGFKNCINQNSIDLVGNYWEDSAIRTWCKTTLYNGFSELFKDIFRTFDNPTLKEMHVSTVVNEIFALPSAYEVYGKLPFYGNITNDGNVQFDYYKTATNRYKKYQDGGSEIAYWTRDTVPSYNNLYYIICTSSSSREFENQYCYNSFGISPYGVI